MLRGLSTIIAALAFVSAGCTKSVIPNDSAASAANAAGDSSGYQSGLNATNIKAISSSSYQNFQLPSLSSSFAVDFDAIPSANSINAVTSLGQGAASAASPGAIVIRFNSSGMIDVLDAGAYKADTSLSYVAGSAYHFHLDVNYAAKTFSLLVTPDGGLEQFVAVNYPFNGSVSAINNFGVQASAGSHNVFDVSLRLPVSVQTPSAPAAPTPTPTPVPTATPQPTPMPTPMPTATPMPVSATAFTVDSPAAGTMVSGMIAVKGKAGSQWVNVAAFDVNWKKLSGDVTPSGGAYALQVDTTKLAAGVQTIMVAAFSVPAGQAGGTYTTVNLSVNVQQATSAPTPTPSPTATPKPTATPMPTATPVPTPMPTPVSGPSASCSGTQYFVDAMNGNDANAGTSAAKAWKSISKVNSPGVKFTAGQCINFVGGQSYSGCLVLQTGTNVTGSSKSNMMVVQSAPGTGLATIVPNCGGKRSMAVLIDDVSGITFQNLVLAGYGTNVQFGVVVQNSLSQSTPADTIIVRNNDISGFATTSDDSAGEIWLYGYPNTGVPGGLNNVQLLNNVLHGANGAASLDDNGISSIPYGQNITNVLAQGNTIYNIGSTAGHPPPSGEGIDAIGWKNSTISYNLIHDIGGNQTTCGGPSGIETYTADSILVEYNEVYNVQPIKYKSGCDWDGYDFDGGTTNSVMQYNYSHHNFGAGYLAYMATVNGTQWGTNIYRYNVSENDAFSAASGLQAAGSFVLTDQGGGNMPVQVYNNSILQNSPGSPYNYPVGIVFAAYAVPSAGSIVANNIIETTGSNLDVQCFAYDGSRFNLSTVMFKANAYVGSNFDIKGCQSAADYTNLASWQAAAPGGDAGATVAAPNFAGSIPVGTCSWTPSDLKGFASCLMNYKLTSASIGYVGTGYSVASPGSMDLFGNRIPNGKGTGFNIGADGGAH